MNTFTMPRDKQWPNLSGLDSVADKFLMINKSLILLMRSAAYIICFRLSLGLCVHTRW